MTLTKLLNYSNKDFKDFRALLCDLFPKPTFKHNGSILAIPETNNYSLVGTAFDYLLRFRLERAFPGNVTAMKWNAEYALIHFKSNGLFVSPHDDFLSDYETVKKWFAKTRKRNERVIQRFKEVEKIHSQFTTSKSSKVDDKLVKACLFLAKLDSVFRAGIEWIEEINFFSDRKSDVADLRQLINICDLEMFRPANKIILNPTFGKGSALVGGADGDMIVDDTLIEVKVTKELNLTRTQFNQLIGYYLLYRIGGISKHKNVRLKRLGIYFARHCYLWITGIKELGTEKSFEKATAFLKRHKKIRFL